MKIIILDTSTNFLYVSFYDNVIDKVLFQKIMITHNNHSENLIPSIEEGLKENNLELKDFDCVVTGNGPGSYTGLRVGCVVSKMMAFALGIKLKALSSLLFIGSGYLNKDGIYAISSVAKKNYKYLRVVRVNNGVIDTLVSDTFLDEDKYNSTINQYENIQIINEDNYKIDSKLIFNLSQDVNDIHNFVPNYLREANS